MHCHVKIISKIRTFESAIKKELLRSYKENKLDNKNRMIPFLKNDLEPLRIKQKDPQLEHGQKMFKMQILTLSLREPLFIPNFWEGLNLSQTSTTFSDYRLALRNGTVLDYLTNEKCFLSKHEYSLVKK